MSQDNTILGGHLNTISNSSRSTVINGANNQIIGADNVHILGDNISVRGANDPIGSIDNDDTFYIGLKNGIYCHGPIYCNGNIESEGDVIAYSTSDERLKDNINNISGCLDKVLSLDAIEFDWNENQKTYTGRDIGLIAQQVQKIAPEVVSKRDDGFLAIKYEKIIPLLVGATKEQDEQIKNLEKSLEDLRKKIID